jgi:hypothetical protein
MFTIGFGMNYGMDLLNSQHDVLVHCEFCSVGMLVLTFEDDEVIYSQRPFGMSCILLDDMQ